MKTSSPFKLLILMPLVSMCSPVIAANVLYSKVATVNESVESRWNTSFGSDNKIKIATRPRSIDQGANWKHQSVSYKADSTTAKKRQYRLYTPIRINKVNNTSPASDRVSSHARVSSAQNTAPAYDPSIESNLFEAVRSGHLSQVKSWLQKGAKGSYKELSSNITVVGLAIKLGRADLVKILGDSGVNLHQISENNTTYLHVAAAQGHLKIAQYLVKSGIKPTVLTTKHWTPLHHAARFGHTALVSYFLGLGINANSITTDGLTAKALAFNAKKFQAANLL